MGATSVAGEFGCGLQRVWDTEQNSKHAIDMAQQLSHQLRAAQQRISELEAEIVAYQNQAERAEQWLHTVYTEIEDRFLQQGRSRARNGMQ